MSEHDKFCPDSDPYRCQCETIAAIRADEREQAAQRIMTILENDTHWNEKYAYCDCASFYCGWDCSHKGMLDAVFAARGGEQK